MPGTHAILSPSAAHRWMHCTAAPRLEEKEPERTSVYAEEGSLAHEICECKLKAYVNGDDPENLKHAEQIFKAQNDGKSWTEHELYKVEMEEFTDLYVDIIIDRLKEARRVCPDARLWVEEKINLTDYVPEGFGTSDAGIIADGFMEVFDFKYGKGVPVEAENNPQMMTYGIGAYKNYEAEYDVKSVILTIIQPRIGNLSSWETPAADLVKWAEEELAPKAKIAFEGTNTTQEPGDWCRFCAVKRKCRALAEFTLSATKKNDTDARLLSFDEIAELLHKAQIIESWVAGVKEYALEAALEGQSIPGFKIVEGRSYRKITNPDELRSRLLSAGYDENTIMRPAELQTLTNLEKLVGRKAFSNLAADCIERPQGKPTLAVYTDKRPELETQNEDFKDIIQQS